MSWIPCLTDKVAKGFLLQCDVCGYIRGSAYKVDKERGIKVRRKLLFSNTVTPETWYTKKILEIGEIHKCPHCRTKEDT